MKRVMVIATLDTGDDVSTSVKVEDGNFSEKDKLSLIKKVNQVIKPVAEDAIYFKVKYNEKVGKLKGISYNMKVTKFSDVESKISEMFERYGF